MVDCDEVDSAGRRARSVHFHRLFYCSFTVALTLLWWLHLSRTLLVLTFTALWPCLLYWQWYLCVSALIHYTLRRIFRLLYLKRSGTRWNILDFNLNRKKKQSDGHSENPYRISCSSWSIWTNIVAITTYIFLLTIVIKVSLTGRVD